MACGLAAIMTAKGTEDYAKHGRNCEIVQPRDVDSIAAGLIQAGAGCRLSQEARDDCGRDAKALSWENASDRMEAIIREIVELHRGKSAGSHSFESFVENL